MALVQTCKCEECGLQRSFANHWVMIVERPGSLTVLPVWDEKKIRRTRHFCGRAHASRFVERWIANPGMALMPDVVAEAESSRAVRSPTNEQDRRLLEQKLMEDGNGDETSSARVVPTRIMSPASPIVSQVAPASGLPIGVTSAVRNPPALYTREMRMMS